jgi:hypothetical protein
VAKLGRRRLVGHAGNACRRDRGSGTQRRCISGCPDFPQKKFVTVAEYHARINAICREALRQAEHLFGTLHRAFTTGL